jgi:hypothetical protein
VVPQSNTGYKTGGEQMSIVCATIGILGLRPLLWHHFGADALPLEKRPKTGVAGNDPEEWRRTVLATAERQLYLEPAYIFGCLRDAAKYTARKRGTLQPLLASTLQVPDDRVLVDRWVPEQGLRQVESDPVYLDVRSVRNPSTRARNVRYRVAAAPGWKASFTVAWENTLVSENEMRAVMRDAGQFVGLGDGRSIGFGRFQVAEFQVLEGRHGSAAAAGRDLGSNASDHLAAGRKAVRPVRRRRKP